MSDQITYDNKVDLQVATNIANINKVTASDMNEIKDVVNSHADDIDELNDPSKWVSVGTTAPTDGRRVWFANSANLFDSSTLESKTYNGASSTTRACSTQSIYLTPGTYTFSTNIDTSIYEFKTDVLKDPPTSPIAETYIHNSGFGTSKTRIITISSAGYFAILIRNKSNTDLNLATLKGFQYQLQKGSTATTYETYVEKTINIDNEKFLGQEELVSVGVNQPSDGKRVWFAKGKNLFNKDTITTGKYITDTGGEGTNNTTFYSGFIKVQPSTTYYVSGRNNGWGNEAFYDENKTFISRINETNSMFTTTSTTYYIRTNGNLNDLNTLQIEQGVQPTSYEPYIEPSINVDGEEWYNPNNVEKYSTNETKIGMWTDGKPIYRSVFDISAISSSNANLVDLNNLNIKFIINLYGTIKDTYNYEYPIPMSDSSSNYNVVFYNGRYIRGRCAIGSGASVAIAKVILEYTKTTD